MVVSRSKPGLSQLQFKDAEDDTHDPDLIEASPQTPADDGMASMMTLNSVFIPAAAATKPRHMKEVVQMAVQKNRQKQEEKKKFQNAVVDAQNDNERRLNSWANDSGGGMKNIRTLLATLDDVLFPWAKAKWKPVGVSDMLSTSGVRISYFKAMRLVHTDRLPEDATAEDAAIANMLYKSLNKAFKNFQEQN